jgi:hypothetical protein
VGRHEIVVRGQVLVEFNNVVLSLVFCDVIGIVFVYLRLEMFDLIIISENHVDTLFTLSFGHHLNQISVDLKKLFGFGPCFLDLSSCLGPIFLPFAYLSAYRIICVIMNARPYGGTIGAEQRYFFVIRTPGLRANVHVILYPAYSALFLVLFTQV